MVSSQTSLEISKRRKPVRIPLAGSIPACACSTGQTLSVTVSAVLLKMFQLSRCKPYGRGIARLPTPGCGTAVDICVTSRWIQILKHDML